MLLGEQQLKWGLEKWRKVRGSPMWPQSADDYVRLVAGRGNSQSNWCDLVLCHFGDGPAATDDTDVMLVEMTGRITKATKGARRGEALLDELIARAAAVDAAEYEIARLKGWPGRSAV